MNILPKSTILLVAFSLIFSSLFSQEENRYRERITKNLDYLIKGEQSALWRSIEIRESSLRFRLVKDDHKDSRQEDVIVPWATVPKLVSRLESLSLEEVKDVTFSKAYWGVNIVNQSHKWAPTSAYKEYPSSMTGLVVGIDPGGFASSFQEAVLDRRYVNIKGDQVDSKKDIKFYEAELNDLTAAILYNKLAAVGAKPFLSRSTGISSLGMTFKQWYAGDVRGVLATATNKGYITNDQFKDYMSNLSDTTRIFNVFKSLEFRNRIEFINLMHPDVTISLHYNSADGNKRLPGGYLNTVDQNYSMAFIPGSFLGFYELERTSEKIDFIRLLLSPDIEKSARLASLILSYQKEHLGVPPVSHDNTIVDDRFCTSTSYEGVYARNLAMTRTIKGPVVYLESLLQDNKQEAINLSKRDYSFEYGEGNFLKAPKRCEEVAESVFQGILQWVEENKLYAKK
jgi:N-acetylmuramoyl-L-alanine amidase